MSAEATPIDEKGSGMDIIRHSYLFSQGSFVVQKALFKWLFHGPWNGKGFSAINKRTQLQILNYYSALHATDNHYVYFIDRVLNRLGVRSEQGAAVKNINTAKGIFRDSAKREHKGTEPPENIELELANHFLDRDTAYLSRTKGRPIGKNSARDRWASFVIDFGLLERGDGYFAWSHVPPEFRDMWRNVMSEIKQMVNYGDQRWSGLKDRYLQKHPDISRSDREGIERFFTRESLQPTSL